jgi:hypothetical protein
MNERYNTAVEDVDADDDASAFVVSEGFLAVIARSGATRRYRTSGTTPPLRM